jgi:DNA polymerase/3'-5' exonuclease PolX
VSDKPKIPRALALAVADELIQRLSPFCERIQIAGSLRRGNHEVGDVELLYIPRFEARQADFFTSAPVNLADEEIGRLLAGQVLAKRPSKIGVFTWGASNKLGLHTASGVPVDMFATSSDNWWVSLVIRTGSKAMNLILTTAAQRRGRTLNAYGSGVTESDGNIIAATSERHVFDLCGVPYLEPAQR